MVLSYFDPSVRSLWCTSTSPLRLGIHRLCALPTSYPHAPQTRPTRTRLAHPTPTMSRANRKHHEQRSMIKHKLESRHFTPCMHAVSSAFQTLFTNLPAPHTCPSCLTQAIIRTLCSSRTQIEQRGGVFVSKERNPVDHDWWMDHWNTASVHGWRVMGMLGVFGEGEEGNEADRSEARRVVGTWREERRKSEGFLGMVGESRKENVGEVDVELLRKYIRMAVEELVRDIEEEDRKGVPMVRIAEPEIEEQEQKEVSIMGPELHRSSVQDTSAPIVVGLRSCLKRKRSPDADGTKRESSAKHVKLADFATVSSDHSHIVAHPFLTALCKRPTAEPHRRSAFCGAGKYFKRGTKTYKPGRWLSPGGFVKQNTSWRGGEWVKFEELMTTEEEEWVTQWEEGSRVANAFQEIFKAWLATRMSPENVGAGAGTDGETGSVGACQF